MQAPEWYPDWRHDAFHEMQAKNARLEQDFGLGRWERFDYDLGPGTLTFSHEGNPKLLCEIQVAGTTSAGAGNWLWAWANPHWPTGRASDSRLVRDFGEKHGICELTHDYVDPGDDLNALGWQLTAVMVRITGALGAYRPPGQDAGLFLVIRNATRVS